MVRSHAQHLESLLAEQRLIAAQKPNLQLFWKFLEDEIAREGGGARSHAQHAREDAVRRHTPTPTKRRRPTARDARGARASRDEEDSGAARGQDRAVSAPQRRQARRGAESKVQPVQKEDALSPVEKAETPSKKLVADVAAQAEEHRLGAGSRSREPARRKKEKLKAFSTAMPSTRRSRAVRRKRILQEEAVTAKSCRTWRWKRQLRKQGTLRASATTRFL